MKQKHKLIVEITFNLPVTEKTAKQMLGAINETGLGDLHSLYKEQIMKVGYPKAYRLVCAGNISALINKLIWRYRREAV